MDKEKKNLCVFGYGLGVIALIFAVGGGLKHGFLFPQKILIACAGVFIGVTAVHWQALRPGYRGWMKVAHVIGAIITTLILGAVFFLMFAPIGIFLRIIGKDHLERRIDRAAESYWHKKLDGQKPRESYLQQF